MILGKRDLYLRTGLISENRVYIREQVLILENRASIKGTGVCIKEQKLILENKGFVLENRAYIREQGFCIRKQGLH